jgi:hypothetical protein
MLEYIRQGFTNILRQPKIRLRTYSAQGLQHLGRVIEIKPPVAPAVPGAAALP